MSEEEIDNDTSQRPNEAQQAILKQFKNNLKDVLTGDYTDKVLLKWLRVRNYNVRKCEMVFREFLAYRAVFKVDTIVEDFNVPEVAVKYNFQSYIGESKDGTPYGYIALGRADLYGFAVSMTEFEVIRLCSYEIEKYVKRLKKLSEKCGRELNEASFIVDMDCFSLRECVRACVIEMGFDLLRLLQDSYPEIWKHIFIINAPFYFYQAFNIIRPICRYTFLRNFHVVSRENSSQLLLKYIDADQLPVFLGGKRVDSKGDPMCSEFIDFGGKIPFEYYLSNKPPLDPSDPGVQDVWIGARSSYNYALVLREANTRIRAEIRSEGGSIVGALLYRAFRPGCQPEIPLPNEYLNEQDERCNVKLVSPCVKLQTHISPIDDEYECPWPGIYITKFDNTSNWMTSRRVIFRILQIPSQPSAPS
ncbi:SEC14-like protein 2 isoform X2 [Parasteatoda tepidariorum]|uniref:SEC14-like protein 2 isoform X2 n=1 Tax=Parasteatoda tepidariorum TaxID=114398 RepID=UPI0039BD0BB4